jgi:hypothetical protein
LPWHRNSGTRSLGFRYLKGRGNWSKVTCPRSQTRWVLNTMFGSRVRHQSLDHAPLLGTNRQTLNKFIQPTLVLFQLGFCTFVLKSHSNNTDRSTSAIFLPPTQFPHEHKWTDTESFIHHSLNQHFQFCYLFLQCFTPCPPNNGIHHTFFRRTSLLFLAKQDHLIKHMGINRVNADKAAHSYWRILFCCSEEVHQWNKFGIWVQNGDPWLSSWAFGPGSKDLRFESRPRTKGSRVRVQVVPGHFNSYMLKCSLPGLSKAKWCVDCL